MSLENIIYDTYGNISEKDYEKIKKVFDNAESNTELYNNLRMYTKCYCNKIIRRNHIKSHLLSKQHREDTKEIIPNDLLFKYNTLNPRYLHKNKKTISIDICKTKLSFD